MTHPTINQLAKKQLNRYEVVVMTSKCARMITNEYVREREEGAKKIEAKETDKPLSSLIKKEYSDERAVKTAAERLYDGYYNIVGTNYVSSDKIDSPMIPEDGYLTDNPDENEHKEALTTEEEAEELIQAKEEMDAVAHDGRIGNK